MKDVEKSAITGPVDAGKAMATGLATVVTDTQGNRDVVGCGENGLLFPAEGVSDLAEYLVDVLSDQEKATQLGRAALHTVKTRFSLERIADTYVRLYSELLEEIS